MSVNDLGPVAGNQVTTRPGRSNAYGTIRTWHKPCSGPGIQDGTVIDADMFNDWLAQLRTTFDSSGIAEDNADDMLWRAIQSAGARWATDTGSANNIVVACSPPILSLRVGQVINVKIAAANADGAVNITVDAQSPKSVLFAGGGAPVQGTLKPNCVERLIWDGTAWRLDRSRMLGFSGLFSGVNLSPSVITLLSPSSATSGATNLGSSTYSNGVFTCGAGEGGWWIFGQNTNFFPNGNALGSQDCFVTYIVGPRTTAEQSNTQYTGNQGNAASAFLVDYVKAGETVQFTAFHLQSVGQVQGYISGARLGA